MDINNNIHYTVLLYALSTSHLTVCFALCTTLQTQLQAKNIHIYSYTH